MPAKAPPSGGNSNNQGGADIAADLAGVAVSGGGAATQAAQQAAAAAAHPDVYFRYRYVIYRGGKFHRFESPSDNPKDDDEEGNSNMAVETAAKVGAGDGAAAERYHQIPLRLLLDRESYVMNDVLGKTTGPPNIDHIRIGGSNHRSSASTLHSREHSRDNISATGLASLASMTSKGSGVGLASQQQQQGQGGGAGHQGRKRAVGFAPAPPTYHSHAPPSGTPGASNNSNQRGAGGGTSRTGPVHLNSTDGLVVVSAFLPVILHRSDAGEWTADWDYEILLSMQTHLRVTRVGVVKWRGWHGNSGKAGSPEAGVPLLERPKVEECLRPFHCVPVWIDTQLFGEM